jgi:hypothetical protein
LRSLSLSYGNSSSSPSAPSSPSPLLVTHSIFVSFLSCLSVPSSPSSPSSSFSFFSVFSVSLLLFLSPSLFSSPRFPSVPSSFFSLLLHFLPTTFLSPYYFSSNSSEIRNGDNAGPYTVDQVNATVVQLQSEFPNAVIVAATFHDWVESLQSVQTQLPVVTSEIGDTWIHGAASDPWKLAAFRYSTFFFLWFLLSLLFFLLFLWSWSFPHPLAPFSPCSLPFMLTCTCFLPPIIQRNNEDKIVLYR